MKKLLLILALSAHLSAPSFGASKTVIVDSATKALIAPTATEFFTANPLQITTGVTGVLPVANGGTNASTAANARTALGLGTGDSPTFTSGTFIDTVSVENGIGAEGITLQATGVQLNGASSGSMHIVPAAASGNGSITLSAGTNAITINNGTAGLNLVAGLSGDIGSAAYTASTAYAPAAGSSSIVTVGTVTSGTWSASFGAVSGANLTTLNASNISSGTLADARNTVSNSTTTTLSSLTTVGAAGAFTTNFPGTTSASSAITGTVKIGNGTAATNVGIGGGNVNVGSSVTVGNSITAAGSFEFGSGAYLASTSRFTLKPNGSNNGHAIFQPYGGGSTFQLCFGDATSASVQLKTSGTSMIVGLADGTAGGSFTASGTLAVTGAVTQASTTTTYKNIATAGDGLVAIRKATRVTAQSAANASICTYTAPAADGSYEVSMNMNVTAVTVLSATLNCDYTDESNTARTMILPVQSLAGNFITGGIIAATGPYETPVMHIRCKASTAITLYTAAGTYTGCVYTAEGIIRQTQ